jgi:hypothetical protein
VRRVFLDDANVSRGPLAVSTRGYLTRLLAVRWTVASSGRLTELRTQPVRCANAISVSRHNTDRSGDTYNNIAEHIGAPIKTNRSKKGSATPQLRRDVLECVCRCLIHLQKYTEALKFSELLVREFAEESDLWFIHGLILSHLNSPHWKG